MENVGGGNRDELATVTAMLDSLFSGNDIDAALESALALAGEATGLDALTVYELVPDPEQRSSRARLRVEWTAVGTPLPPPPPLFTEGLERWLDRLHAGHEIGGALGELEASERRLLELRGFRWLLGIPLRVDGGLWGVALFGDRRRERPVDPTRLPFLHSLAATLAVGIRLDRTSEQRDNAEQILRVLLDLIPAGVFWKDARGTIRGCNEAFARLAGLEDSATVVSRTAAQLEFPDDPLLVGFRDDDAPPFGASVQTSRLELRNDRGAISGVLGCCAELSPRRDIEVQLRQALKLEALGQLTGEIVHDFNNVLTSITGHACLAMGAVGASSPAREPLEAIQKS